MEVLNKGHPIRGWPIEKAKGISFSNILECLLVNNRYVNLVSRELTRHNPTKIDAMFVNDSIYAKLYDHINYISGHCRRMIKSELNSNRCTRHIACKSAVSLLIRVVIRKHILGVRFIRAPGIMQRRPIIGCALQ